MYYMIIQMKKENLLFDLFLISKYKQYPLDFPPKLSEWICKSDRVVT